MILLLMLKFEPDRRILYLSMDRMAVYHRQDGKCARPFLFDVTGNGLQHFNRYLQQTPRMTTCMVVDLAQEEYRQDVIPHVSASDRQAIITRKKQQYFRDTPFVHAAILGREAEGRRDDIVMYTALTNPDQIRPWAEILFAHRAPLAGICSPAHLAGWLLDYLPGISRQRLVVSLHGITGLRQTCFQDNKLKMGRLLDLPFGNTAVRARHMLSETEVMLRYLHTMGTLGSSDPLDIFYLADGNIIDQLRQQTENTELAQYYFIDVAGLALKMGLTEKIAAPFCDQLLIHLLFKNKLPNYYATHDQMRNYHMRNAGQLVHAASAGLLFIGLCWAGLNYAGGVEYHHRAIAIKKQAEYFSSMNRIARSRLPVTDITPVELGKLGNMARDLERQKVDPQEMLGLISTCMGRFPLIGVERIEWSANTAAQQAAAVADMAMENNKNVSNMTPPTGGGQRHQMAIMHAYIDPFQGDYRAALSMIDAFRAQLESAVRVRVVEVLTLPLDTRPEASMEGSSGMPPTMARFSLKIVMDDLNET